MSLTLEHRKRGDGKSDEHTKRTGARKRAEAAAEFAMPVDEYRNAYREFFTSLMPEARLALQRQIIARIEACGNAGLIDDPAEYERLITEGLLPYTEPQELDDGIVPADVVKIHDRCVSRRALIAYLEGRAEVAGHLPPLFDGRPVTRDDMALLDLDANDYRFFNAYRPRTRRQDAVAYEPPAQDIDDDADDDDDDDRVDVLYGEDAGVAYNRIRTELIELRYDIQVDDVDEHIEIIIDPETTLREMITILTNTVSLLAELDYEDVERLLPEFRLRGVPRLDGFPNPWDDFEEYVPLNLNVGQRQAVSEMVASYHLQDDRFTTPRAHALLMEKLRYLLFDYTIGMTAGDEEVLVAYQYYPFEICATIQHALQWNDMPVLYLLDEWIQVEKPELNSNPGHRIPCASVAVAHKFEEYRRRYDVLVDRHARYVDAPATASLIPINPAVVNDVVQRIIHYESELRAQRMDAD